MVVGRDGIMELGVGSGNTNTNNVIGGSPNNSMVFQYSATPGTSGRAAKSDLPPAGISTAKAQEETREGTPIISGYC